MVKNLPPNEMGIRSLDWEDLLEEHMAIHASLLAGRISRTKEPGRLYIVHGVAKSQI